MLVSRSEYVARNTVVSITIQIVKNIFSFVSRTIFIKVLGSEYLGVNSLFTEILTVLSFAELGIGSAIIYSLYKPLAEKDNEKLKSLMALYAKAYRAIGVSIMLLGIMVIPFLGRIVGEVDYVKENISLLYCLFLFNSAVSYFFVYKKSLIIADQKNYIVDIYTLIFFIIQIIVQSVLLLVAHQYILYLIAGILLSVMCDLCIAKKADKMFPFLKDRSVQSLEKTEIRGIVANVKALVVYKFGGIIINGTDSIFISYFINVATVGLYSNYKTLIAVFTTIGGQVMNSVIASIGNLNAEAQKDKLEKVFNEAFFLNNWFFGFSAAGLFIFLTDFIKVWLGEAYILSVNVVFASCVYYYITNMHYPCYAYRTTAGLFIFGRYVPLFAAILNIFLDIVFGLRWGLTGIIWASIISRTLTYELIDPILIYKKVFNRQAYIYFVRYFVSASLIIINTIVCRLLLDRIFFSGIVGLFLKALLMTVLFNGLFILLTFRTSSFKSIINRYRDVFNALKKKHSN